MENKFDFGPYKDCLRHKAFDSRNATRPLNGFTDDDYPYYDVTDPFMLDIEKAMNSKAYRRLFGKTQVYPFPVSPYTRNRGFHSGEVVSIGTILAAITGLNVLFVQAGSIIHDFGQVPFGHLGENFMSRKLGLEFLHSSYSVIVCRKIERNGLGLNLCLQTEGAVKNHSRTRDKGVLKVLEESPEEDALVMYSDKFGYTFADVNDAIATGQLNNTTLIKEIKWLGKNQRERILHCEYDLVKESAELGKVSFSNSEVAQIFIELRDFMFDNVYLPLNKTEEHKIILNYLENVYDGFLKIGLDKIQALTLISIMTDLEVKSFSGIFDKTGQEIITEKTLSSLFPIDVIKHPIFTSEQDFVTITI